MSEFPKRDTLAALASENVEALVAAIADNTHFFINEEKDEKLFGELLGDLKNPELLNLLHPLIAHSDTKIMLYAIDRALMADRLPHAESLAGKYLQKFNFPLQSDLWEAYINEVRSALTDLKADFLLQYNGFSQLVKNDQLSLFRAIKYKKTFETLLAAGVDANKLNEKGESLFYAIIGSTVNSDAKLSLCLLLQKHDSGLSIEPCGEFSLSPVFYCIKLGHTNLFQFFYDKPGLEKLKTAANENVVHYLSRYNHTRVIPDLPKKHLQSLFAEQDSTGIFAFERYVLAEDPYANSSEVCQAIARAFKDVIQQGMKVQNLQRVMNFLGPDLAEHYIEECMNEIWPKEDIPWLNDTSLTLAEIPMEILQLICEKLPLPDVFTLTRVAKSVKVTEKIQRAVLVKYKPLLKLEQVDNWRERFAKEARLYHNWMTGRYRLSSKEWLDCKLYKFLNLDEHWLVTVHHMMTKSVLAFWNCHKKKLYRTECRAESAVDSCILQSSPEDLPTVVLYNGMQVKLFRGGKIIDVPITVIGEQKNRRTELTVRPVAKNIFIFDGIVWDIDTNQALHTFKREDSSSQWAYCFNPFTRQYIIQNKNEIEIYSKEFKFMRRIQFSDAYQDLRNAALMTALDENIILFRSSKEDFTLDLDTLETKFIVSRNVLQKECYNDLTRVIEHSGVMFQLVDARCQQRSQTYVTIKAEEAMANSKYLFLDSKRSYYDFDV